MILQIVGFKIQENNLDATHDTIFKILWLHNSDNQAPWHIGEDITLQEDHVDHMKHFNAGEIKVLCKVNIINKLSRVHINKILLK